MYTEETLQYPSTSPAPPEYLIFNCPSIILEALMGAASFDKWLLCKEFADVPERKEDVSSDCLFMWCEGEFNLEGNELGPEYVVKLLFWLKYALLLDPVKSANNINIPWKN